MAHYAIGLGGMYWCARQVDLSRLAATYVAGTFIFSTWLAPSISTAATNGPYTAVYIPWTVGLPTVNIGPTGYSPAWPSLWSYSREGSRILPLCSASLRPAGHLLGIQKRSLAPIAGLVLMAVTGAGVSAVNYLPAVKLLREYPRYTQSGGVIWTKYTEVLLGPSRRGSVEASDRPDAARMLEDAASAHERTIDLAPTPDAKARPSKRDLPAFVTKVFLGREQHSETTYFPVQGYGWHRSRTTSARWQFCSWRSLPYTCGPPGRG